MRESIAKTDVIFPFHSTMSCLLTFRFSASGFFRLALFPTRSASTMIAELSTVAGKNSYKEVAWWEMVQKKHRGVWLLKASSN